MGTTWSVNLNAPGLSRQEQRQARVRIQESLDAVDRSMSTWDQTSEVSRFNAHPSTEPFPLSEPTLRVLALAHEVSEQTDGAFDVTVRPLVAAWGFGADARIPGIPPDEAELEFLGRRVGFQRLELDPETGTARKTHPALEIDLSAIAKGFAVDEVGRALQGAGFSDFLVEVGGEVLARGERPDGGPWRLAIERPEPDGRALHAVVALEDQAMATSGDYRNFYEAGERRLAHIVDPRNGRPVDHALASVSVVHPQASLADAWATALTVLGPEEGLRLAESLELSAYLISRRPDGSYQLAATDGFPPIQTPADEVQEAE